MKTLSGKIALVTGASSGIGRAIALQLGSMGAYVLVHYGSSYAKAREVLDSLRALGGDGEILCCDFSGGIDQIGKLGQTIIEKYRSIDILVNNAGYSISGSLSEITAHQFDQVIQTNVKSALFLTKSLARHINESGRIIFISSMVTQRSNPDLLLYSMSKGAMEALTLSLAKEFSSKRITVNAVRPGAVHTSMSISLSTEEGRTKVAHTNPFGRFGEPQDIAGAVSLLVSEQSAWITGQFLNVDGGSSL